MGRTLVRKKAGEGNFLPMISSAAVGWPREEENRRRGEHGEA